MNTKRGIFQSTSFLFLVWFVLPIKPIYSQPIMVDTTLGKKVLVGDVGIETLQDSVWYDPNSVVDSHGVQSRNRIDSLSKWVTVKVYFGSWCSDSHRWVPYSWSLFQGTQLEGRVDLIGLPRDKIIRDSIAPGMNILKVPTFVIYKNDKEIGRIIENPEDNFPNDLIKILASGGISSE